MTLRKLTCAAALLTAVVLTTGCGDDAPPQVPSMQPPLPAQAPLPPPLPPSVPAASPTQGPELTAIEQGTLKSHFAAEANVEITDDNAVQAAAALEQEIDAELAAEQ